MRYSAPYLVYLFLLGLVPFLWTFLIGLNPAGISEALKGLPVGLILYNTFAFATITALASTGLGLLLAVSADALEDRVTSGLAMLPYSIPFTSSALIWGISLYGGYGWFTYLLGIRFDPLNLASTAIWGITLVGVWSTVPLPFLITYSSLRSVPKEFRETAKVMGIPLSKYYGELAIPYVGKAILVSLLLSFTLSVGNFDLPFVLTGGGPGFSSTTLPLVVYEQMSVLNNVTGGAFFAAVLSLIAVVPALGLLRVLRAKRPTLPSVGLKLPDLVFKALLGSGSVVVLAFLVIPVYWMVLVAFRSATLDFRSPPVLAPVGLTTHYFLKTMVESWPYMVSSVIVSSLAALLSVFLSSPAAYEVSTGKGRWILPLSIFLYAMPVTSFVIPVYLIMYDAGLVNTWWALVLSIPVFTATFSVWVLTNSFLDLPRSYFEAAEVFDVKNKFFRLILPLIGPSLISTFVLSFIFSWHALFYPLVLTNTPFSPGFPPQGAETVTIFALDALGDKYVNWGQLGSAALVSALPVMLVNYLAVYRIRRGIKEGGVKFA
ncbi:ABC transporter permease [Sulfodiicoccus acidiphilus]|uniref:ABC transporter permease n=1 Tax=Sulfodiicoccus acidiphilus TaxID=1670455 RepID=A0A348B263_9CREN|nr:ABC transporter permease subunit [Sulfodiicoccus acidiphilus]BBD72265.1 ABC transporter permease [Sulfodiicoccus acidiphilus]GGT90681.1 ABC transporter permease [Sulfodiicoccus acidiphilus]